MSPVPGGRSTDQVVEVLPVGVVEQLLQGLGDHRAAPDHRRLLVDQETDRHGLQVVAVHRLQRLAVLRLRLAVHAEHARLAGAVDVRIQNADLGALGRQRQGQVHGGGGLADAALAGGHGDDVPDALDVLDALLRGMGGDLARHVDDGGLDAVHGLDQRLQLRGQVVAVAGGRKTQHDLHGRGVAVDGDLLDALGGYQVLFEVGIHVGRQFGFDLVFACSHFFTPGSVRSPAAIRAGEN